MGRHGVVRGGDRLARPANGQPAGPETAERLRARDLVDEVEVDGKDRGRTLLLEDDMVVPDLGEQGPGLGGGRRHGESGCGVNETGTEASTRTSASRPSVFAGGPGLRARVSRQRAAGARGGTASDRAPE